MPEFARREPAEAEPSCSMPPRSGRSGLFLPYRERTAAFSAHGTLTLHAPPKLLTDDTDVQRMTVYDDRHDWPLCDRGTNHAERHAQRPQPPEFTRPALRPNLPAWCMHDLNGDCARGAPSLLTLRKELAMRWGWAEPRCVERGVLG